MACVCVHLGPVLEAGETVTVREGYVTLEAGSGHSTRILELDEIAHSHAMGGRTSHEYEDTSTGYHVSLYEQHGVLERVHIQTATLSLELLRSQ